jgi:hypothetical protein
VPMPDGEPAAPGVVGNARLTALAGAVLLALILVEVVTLPSLRELLSVHVLVGVLLAGPLAVKIGSTGYRFVRYYIASRACIFAPLVSDASTTTVPWPIPMPTSSAPTFRPDRSPRPRAASAPARLQSSAIRPGTRRTWARRPSRACSARAAEGDPASRGRPPLGQQGAGDLVESGAIGEDVVVDEDAPTLRPARVRNG